MSINLRDVTYIYKVGTPFARVGIEQINLEIKKGEFIGLIGPTGSGKSTLIQHLNGLLKPTSGRIYIDGQDITANRVDLKKIRQKVGVVFQYPEHQLFEETVFADVAFGPRNMGLDEREIERRVRKALKMVGLDDEKLYNRSPFNLSGGQKRRVAIAGVLAMEPQFLILDEPTAGLDPRGRDEILEQIRKLHQELAITVVLVSHSMEDIARLTQRIIVMYRGRIVMQGTPRQIFRQSEQLRDYGLDVPLVTELMLKLKTKGYQVKEDIFTVEEAEKELVRLLRCKHHA
ncbi:energy-coupling factor transporter ATPase [Calderihabitans maritimus]|uniref:Energy-coupling factor transporter ATP-binding protein EcfA2 n=1 Tax=Calderihabitans maritimus TaxID=1246530 RepID=A0A1Z5HN35_9FIRM|nr:energy-coupling factor transporter ATPase [Calderihabitans maritimus]GAW90878.1 ATPase component of general energizing module of ECF transporters [Calderihabitans maritimus]